MQLIRNAHVVTCDSLNRSWERADIVIKGDTIQAIGPEVGTPVLAADHRVLVIEGARKIAVPGLVNAHLHSSEAFDQGRFERAPLEVWLALCYSPLFPEALPKRLHYLRTMLCCLQSLKSGVSTVQDDLATADSVAVDGAAEAYQDARLRASLAINFADRPYLDGYPWLRELVPNGLRLKLGEPPARSLEDQFTAFEALKERWHGAANGRVRLVLGPRGPQRCTDALMERLADVSARDALPVHMHVLETRTQAITAQQLYGKTLIEVLEERSLLNCRLTLNHAIWLTASDIEAISRARCSTTHNPLSNMKLGSGISPIRRLMKAGVNVALGTDGAASSDTFDQIAALRATSLLHTLVDTDPEMWVSAQEALRMSTINAAATCMRDVEIGSLEVGKKADVALLDTRHLGLIPVNDPVRQLAYSVSSEAVDTMIIGGQIVMRDRKILAFDENALLEEILEEAERYRCEVRPRMERASARLVPYLRAMYERATAAPAPPTENPQLF